ncbi:uroporphyrinogen-III synthase [Thiohalomonas denitrificans]|uniref:Uroporphyrinogen-III synthase n=1 Tax=Thiohalomonas denitrificans TaxID=415747 RepID=A0A1G5QYF4_9GAMM|nr:uroporphyrinogen-III synthase [Thiohalomonas denitrificans]SCZ66746.1 uroporphyrinogen-III synthase [Thiohalomonas denitrificans]
MQRGELQGLRVLVTRPAHQAENLCGLIAAAGGEPIAYPTLAITAPRDPERVRQILARVSTYDMVVFISANAATFAVELLQGRLPQGPTLATVGKGTAAQLERLGRAADLVAEGGDSESLLAMPQLNDLSGCRVLIIRGEQGREQLAEGLRKRGAEVEYAEVYRRSIPKPVPGIDPTAADVVTATSFEALANLERLVGAERVTALHALALAVFHPRIAEKARTSGFHGPVMVAREPGDEALVAAIAAWAQTKLQD